MFNLEALRNKVLNNYKITKADALNLVNAPFNELTNAANEIREHFCGNCFDACTIINVKSGKCSENCKFCAQSIHHNTDIDTYPIMSEDEIKKKTLPIYNSGFKRISYVASGKNIEQKEFETISKAINEMKRDNDNIKLCVSLGFLKKDQIINLKDAGVEYVIIGHSERRDIFGENDILINQKVKKAFASGLTPILCCGESLEQREMGVTMDWIRLQIKSDLKDVAADDVKNLVIAYEPIWAIGTGKTATTEQAEEVCKGIRECIAEIYDEATAEAVRIQYGGSVNAGNAAELFAQPDIDGGLVGGASLKADFGKIVNY